MVYLKSIALTVSLVAYLAIPNISEAAVYTNRNGSGLCLAYSGQSLVLKACNSTYSQLRHNAGAQIVMHNLQCLTRLSPSQVGTRTCGPSNNMPSNQRWTYLSSRQLINAAGGYLYAASTTQNSLVALTNSALTSGSRLWTYSTCDLPFC